MADWEDAPTKSSAKSSEWEDSSVEPTTAQKAGSFARGLG